ncbi:MULTISPECIES: hypothetical protein [unclassified Variovorax]|jgi:hypothetical protein|uniref:hypothetical protein n=1 Tax=unclassified Variovorax TaxID=663243 RepID=UPI000F7F201A|nr:MULTISPECIES: hypothetical protein [unclassified Variovorax]RSZ40921.1 hypothetical protein EJO70_13535 [Variovorax sp. 553]RSZ42170.1 hypothetical protein EJO71_15505 [Variovorax sp. 679]
MHRVRLFVLWIMMFAVPFQGYAAASMVFCGPGHAGSATEMSADQSGAHGDAPHPHSADEPGDHHHETAQAAKPPAKGDTAKAAGAGPDAMHKCGTCGACHATALTSTLELAVFHDLPRADLAEPAIAVATLAPRVLDRPPRA